MMMMMIFFSVPPDIDDEASSGEVLMKEGEDASLRCVASGTPPPTIVWRREDSRHFRINNQTLGKVLLVRVNFVENLNLFDVGVIILCTNIARSYYMLQY